MILADAPLYHIAGMICGLTLLAYTGATVVLLNRLDPLAVLQAIERTAVTWWYAMAPMLRRGDERPRRAAASTCRRCTPPWAPASASS